VLIVRKNNSFSLIAFKASFCILKFEIKKCIKEIDRMKTKRIMGIFLWSVFSKAIWVNRISFHCKKTKRRKFNSEKAGKMPSEDNS